MDARVKALWVAALRSGDYRQAQGQLRVDDNFCCLGVLCNLHALEHPEFAAKQPGHSYDDSSSIVGPTVRAWAGLAHSTGAYGKNLRKSLAVDNDRGATFPELADTIEVHF